ncbi:carbonic anhydrase 2-like [Drosophila obscura]|uniref:carbonic anhydrase 2-like n=1 Tax=Drosophila obscura TaxID=7282 RepID=UPI001BB192B5|nr:carbonic anhydrase 2-like [Drosophila obscura]
MPKLIIIQTLRLFLPLAYAQESPPQINAVIHWDYNLHGEDWPGICHTGWQQSPIKLDVKTAVDHRLPRINLVNYNTKLRGPLILVNNGHSANMEIHETLKNEKPYISGGWLKGKYLADGVHFHWGSSLFRGAEHWINNDRKDLEMHIVHRNSKYSDLSEAVKHSDGVAVLAVLFHSEEFPVHTIKGIDKIVAQLKAIRKFEAEANIAGSFSLSQLLENLDTGKFFTYKGSLTTPDCQEAVIWTVFAQTLAISKAALKKFWKLQNFEGQPNRPNFRYAQNVNGRTVYYRKPKD